MDVSLATFLVASFLFSALNKREEIESSQFVAQQRERKKEGIYLDLRRTVLRKKRKRIFSRVAITRVPTHPLLLLLLPWSSSRCPFFFRPCRSPFLQRRTFLIVGREKKTLKEKDEKKRQRQKKMCQTDGQTRKRDEEESFLDSLWSFPNQKILKAHSRSLQLHSYIVSSLLSALLRFSFSKRSIHSSHFSLVARARIYISKRAISTRVSRETRREKEREGKKT